MSDAVIVLVAAFGGGLAGAVLQPLVEYQLSRVRRNDEIRKQRERRLRQMIEQDIGFVRQMLLMIAGDTLRVERGEIIDPQDSWSQVVLPRKVWQPKRIPVPDLRKMADELDSLPMRLVTETAKGGSVLLLFPIIEGRRRDLQDAIIAKMDQLHWPEEDNAPSVV
jgi:hypothetical protein